MENILNNYVTKIFDKPIVHFSKIEISIFTVFYLAFIVLIGNLVYFAIKFFMNLQVKKGKIRQAQAKSLQQLLGYIVFIITILFLFNALGYSLSYVFVGSTALLVGLGFGLQQLFLDMISGVILLIDRNFNLGDVVRLDTSSGKENLHGRIQHVGLRTTLLQTIDNEFMVIPNSKFLSSGITSFMKDKGSARFRVTIQVEYKQDMELVKEILSEAVLKNSQVEKKPDPTIIIKEFRDNGILLEVRFWMKEIFYTENVLSEIRFQILEDFRKNNINIPFPQIVLHQTK